MTIRRGDIYYVHTYHTQGSEQRYGRPAVIVSNDRCNHFSPVVEVVFLTTREKPPLPTHVEILSAKKASTALCEQIKSIDKEHLDGYIGHVSEDEMAAIDQALLVSLGLDQSFPGILYRSGSPDEEEIMARVALRYVENYIRKKDSCSPEE